MEYRNGLGGVVPGSTGVPVQPQSGLVSLSSALSPVQPVPRPRREAFAQAIPSGIYFCGWFRSQSRVFSPTLSDKVLIRAREPGILPNSSKDDLLPKDDFFASHVFLA